MKSDHNYKNAKLPSDKMEANIAYFKNVFSGDETLLLRPITNPSNQAKFCLVYVDGMVNNKLLNDDVIKPLLEFHFPKESDTSLIDMVADQSNFSNSVEKTSDMEKLIQGIIYGDTVL